MARGIVRGGLNDGEGNIKSVQHIETTMSAAISTVDITLNPGVDIEKTILLITTTSTTANTISNFRVEGYLTTSTNLRFVRGGTSGEILISCIVIELKNVKIQRGRATTSSTSHKVDITTVNLQKSFLVFSWSGTGTGTNTTHLHLRGYFNSESQITFGHVGATGNKVSWYVVEGT